MGVDHPAVIFLVCHGGILPTLVGWVKRYVFSRIKAQGGMETAKINPRTEPIYITAAGKKVVILRCFMKKSNKLLKL
jgi:hypothetical protein